MDVQAKAGVLDLTEVIQFVDDDLLTVGNVSDGTALPGSSTPPRTGCFLLDRWRLPSVSSRALS